jgi:hypothetical protein
MPGRFFLFIWIFGRIPDRTGAQQQRKNDPRAVPPNRSWAIFSRLRSAKEKNGE